MHQCCDCVNSLKDRNRELENHIRELQKENEKLRQLERLTSNKYCLDDIAGIVVLFRNSGFKQYRPDLERFIERLHENLAYDDGEKTTEDNAIIGCSEYFSNFVLDVLGWPILNNITNVTEGFGVPLYKRLFEDTGGETDTEGPAKQSFKRMKSFCFNCRSEDHILAKCPAPRNYDQIAESRRQFLEDMNFLSTRQRYTLRNTATTELSQDPRFSKFRPGVISDELRRAMSIDSKQLPPFIYHMRRLGYPPGHLLDAELGQHQVSMDLSKDGSSKTTAFGMTYDIDKIYDYPGFNQPVPEGVTDEWQRYGMPPMQPYQMKDEFVKAYKCIKIRHKKRRRQAGMNIAANNGSATEDMQFSDGDDEESVLDQAEMSIEDLEQQKMEILKLLADEDLTLVEQLQMEAADMEQPTALHSAAVESGAPYLLQPTDILPSADKFAKDMTPLLPFELPENVATGNFMKIRNLIDKIRERLNDV